MVYVASFRWAFWLNLPFCAIGMGVISFSLKDVVPEEMWTQKLARIDWIGGCLFAASASSFLIGISWGGIQFPWDDFRTLVPLIGGAFGLLATVAWEGYYAQVPFIRRSLFNTAPMIAAYLGAVFQGMIVSEKTDLI